MTSKKYAFGIIVLVLMASLLFAQAPVFNQQNLKESQVIITPADQDGRVINISALVFSPATTTGGTTAQDAIRNWTIQCGGNQTCVQQLAQQATAASRDYQMNLTSLQNAHFVVLVFNPQGNTFAGQWTPVPGCEDVVADQPGTAYRPDSTGAMVPYTYYFGQCNLNTAIDSGPGNTTGRVRYDFRVTLVPQPDQGVSSSSAEYSYTSAQVSASSAFTQQIKDFIAAVSSSGGAGLGAGSLPCVGVFLILGLLMASLYFSGKSPISLLDITTPRLPTPKGVAASGQILAPYGYGEMKATANTKMAAAAKAMDAAASQLQRQNPDSSRMAQQAGRLSAGTPDAARDRQVAGNIAVLGRAVGFSSGQLAPLVNKLPYHYGDAEHKLVAQILEAAQAKGGREALLAGMTKDYIYGQAMLKQLDVLSGHPDVGVKSKLQGRVESTLGKFVGSNRYAIVGGATMAGVGSMFRTTRVMGRMTKAIVEETPNVARVTARTTMEMLGGKNIVEELEAKGRSSPTAAWVAGQLQKHPSEVVIGAMYPINDKMGYLYKSLRNEATHDEMRYVLKQIYRKMGVNFNMSEEELATMGHVDMDILKRSGYASTAAMAAVEEEIRRVLANSSMDSQAKLSALMRVAETHGATIDHQMLNFSRRLDAIEATAQPDHVKLLLLNQALEEQNRVRMATNTGGRLSPDGYVCHVGGGSLRGNAIWETMVLRTMIYDGEHGFLKGGIREELVSARLNVANRLTGLLDVSGPNPAAAEAKLHSTMALLPEHMRDANQLKAVSERNRQDLVSLFTEEGRTQFSQYKGKNIQNASISEIVDFMYGGNTPRTGATDPKTGRKIWWTADAELGLNANATMVDVKRHWTSDIKTREMFQLAPWTEAKFTRGNVAAYDASIEAQVKRMPGYATMTGEQEAQAAKKLWIQKALVDDMESRFNSQFSGNAYGTTRETMKFYGGIMAGFLERAIDEKKGHAYQQELAFLEKMDLTSPKDLGKFKDLLHRYNKEYNEVVARPMTYDDIVKSKKAIVLLQEGGYAYYKKGMVLSDMDRVMAGQAALRDDKGQLRPFIPEDVAVTFGSRDDLTAQYHKLRMSKDTGEWSSFMTAATKWAKEGGYSYDREKVLGAVLWEYGTKTHDYDSFWKNSAITVEAKRQVAPVAPSVLRMFGAEAPGLMKAVEPFRNLAMAGGDMISKVAYKAGGSVLTTSYTGAAVAAAYSAHSFDLSRRIMAGEGLETLTEKEANAFRAYAATHGAFTQARQWAFDRSPFGYSTSHGTNAADAAMFAHGPGLTFKQSDYIGATMDKATMWNFNAFYGWPMDLARRLIAPYATAVSSAQKEMVGRAGRWDTTGDQYRMLHHTEPRVRNAMQSFFNPFSLSNTKLARKLNVWQGAAAHSQTGGEDVMLGLSASTQDITLYRKGIYVNARFGDVNPRETYYDARLVKHLDAPMAYELMKDSTFKFQREVQDDANAMTVRRTAAAETLAIKRSQELMSFNSLQTPQGKFYSPVHFALQTLRVPDMISKHVSRTKYGMSSPSVGDSMKRSVNNMATGLKKFTQPGQLAWETRCAKCGARNGRYSKCTSCGATLW